MTWAHLPDQLIAAWPKLSPSAKAVAVAVASFMNRGGRCWPSRQALGERAGIGRWRTVSDATRELQDAGVLAVKRRQRQSCIYSWRRSPGTLEGTESVLSENLEGTVSVPHEGTESVPQKTTTEQEARRRRKTPAPGVSNPWAVWVDVWREHFNGSKPDPANLGRHASAAKAVAKLVKDDSEVRRVFAAYLADQDPYLVRNGHGLALILGRIDAYREVNADHMERIFR